MPSPACTDPRRKLGPYQLEVLEGHLASGVPAHRARRLALWAPYARPIDPPARREAPADNHHTAADLFAAALTEE